MRGYLRVPGSGFQLRHDLPEPIPAPHEVQIDVLQAGICETDLQLIAGYMNFSGVLGHEFVGIPRTGKFAGQVVVGEINCCPAERCAECPELRNHCHRRSVLGIFNHDGAFADVICLPEENLYVVPAAVDLDQAVFVEPLAAAFQILQQVTIGENQKIAVLGDGRLGYLIAQVLAETGAAVHVVGKHTNKLKRFAARNLATHQLAELPEVWFRSRPFEIVVDATGRCGGFELALKLVKPTGKIVLKTTIAGEQTFSLAAIVIDEIQVIGSRCGPFAVAVEALAQNRIEVQSLITARYELEQIEQAILSAQQSKHQKVIVELQRSRFI